MNNKVSFSNTPFTTSEFGFTNLNFDAVNHKKMNLASLGGGSFFESIFDSIGIDFDCINASFPPEKAQKDTTAFLNSKYSEFSVANHLGGVNFKALEQSVNRYLKIVDYVKHWRKLTSLNRQGCTAEGEMRASQIAESVGNNLINELQNGYNINITTQTATYTSGFRGAPSRPTPYRSIKILGKKGSNIVNTSSNGMNSTPHKTMQNNSLMSTLLLSVIGLFVFKGKSIF